MILLAILLPWVSFLLRGKILTAIICLILQILLIGWIPAAIWAVVSLNNERADKRTDKIVEALKQQNRR
jgi:TM2 domain-containing membrane protein YozV